MTLADQLAADLGAVFFAEDGFSAVLTIEGQPVRAMWDDTAQPGRDAWPDGMPAAGLFEETRILLVRSADMPKPLVGQELEIDGGWWTVRNPVEEAGMLRLTLARAAS